jgi:retron-type reverse transcriptase
MTPVGALAVGICSTPVNWILDADIRSFFDTVSKEWLVRFLEHRIGDERIIRLVRKWLKAGVLEDGEWSDSEAGTPQGAVASPLLSNAYLHYVFDLWADRWRRREAKGKVIMLRFADDIFAYHAVPTNSRALGAFRHHVTTLWRRTLRRRSQKDGMTWERITKIADAWLPRPRILHPWPDRRFAVNHPRWEPNA